MTKNPTVKLVIRCIWCAIALVATICTLTDHISFLGGDCRPVTLFFTSWSVWIDRKSVV